MKLIDVKPIGVERGLVHLNRGSQPHSWEIRDWPVYPEYPDGTRLREARFAVGLTQSAAARKIGMSVVDYSKLENGRKVLESSLEMNVLIARLESRDE